MSAMVRLEDGSVELLDSETDLERLIDERMGMDARDYFREICKDYRRELEDLQDEINDLKERVVGHETD